MEKALLFLLLIFILLLPVIVYPQENISTGPIETSSIKKGPPKKRFNIVADYTGVTQFGFDVGIEKALTLGYRYGTESFDQVNVRSGSQITSVKGPSLDIHSVNLDWYLEEIRFIDSWILSFQIYRLDFRGDKKFFLEWQNENISGGDIIYGARGVISYKWFSDKYGINGGPGASINFAGGTPFAISAHLALGITF